MIDGGTALQVSVICPVFNTPADVLRAATGSVLLEASQSVCQLIFADDHSDRPETTEALAALAAADPRIVVLRAIANGGPARARNMGLQAVTGDWVAFIDADDLWNPDHLALIRGVVASTPGAAWVSANHELLDAAGRRTASAPLSNAVAGVRSAASVHYARPAATRALIGNYWLHLGGCVVRTDLARQVGFDERCAFSEDWLFFACLSTLADLYYLERATYVLRRAHASYTGSSRRLTRLRASGKRAALTRPELAPFRRELRWALLTTYKGLAANNLLAGHRGRAAWFGLRALAMDPREIGSALRLWRWTLVRDPARLMTTLRAYTNAELTLPQ